MADSFDMFNRDPNNINDNLQCYFEDVFAEPEGTHSIDCVWKFSCICFNCWKELCYKLATLFCGICIAAEWGCSFAIVLFNHIWWFTPFFKMLDLNCRCCKKTWTQCVNCYLDPCCTACGQLFVHIKK